MSSQSRSSGVNVNSGLVSQEVFIDGERSFNGSIGEDFFLDFGDSSNRVGFGSELFVVGKRGVISSNTRFRASRGIVLG
jgi:hypothetical protein